VDQRALSFCRQHCARHAGTCARSRIGEEFLGSFFSSAATLKYRWRASARRAALKYDLVYCIVKSIAVVNHRLLFFCSVSCPLMLLFGPIRAQRILSLDIPGPGLSLIVVSGKGKLGQPQYLDHLFGSPRCLPSSFRQGDDGNKAVTGGRASPSLCPTFVPRRVSLVQNEMDILLHLAFSFGFGNNWI
jgi:hypothetical protein